MSETPDKKDRDEGLQNKVALVVGVLVVLLAIWSLYSLYRPPDGARDFIRVGGASRIETSIEAVRFWSQADRIVVVPGWMHDKEILEASVRAARLDAPLLLVGKPLSQSARQELERWGTHPSHDRFCEIGFSGNSSALKTFQKEVKQEKINPCPESVADKSGRTSIPPVHLVAPEAVFLPSQIPNELQHELRLHSAESIPRDECDLLGKLRDLVKRLSSERLERASNLGCTLPDTVVFATAQNHPELPDVAVAIALAAHLKGSSDVDQERSPSVDQAVVVILPRYLESSRSLETYLHERGTKVARGVVIGGERAVGNDLNKQLRSVMALTNIGAIVQGSSNLIDKLGVVVGLLIALGILGVGAGVAARAATETVAPQIREFLEKQGEPAPGGTQPPPPPGRTPKDKQGGPDMTRPVTEGMKEEGTAAETWTAAAAMDSLRSVVNKYQRDQDVWVRLRLSSPAMWVAGTLEDPGAESAKSPFPHSQPLWLTNIVQCNAETGELRFVNEGREPLRRANALAVPWGNVQLFEVVNRDIVNALKNDSAVPEGGIEEG